MEGGRPHSCYQALRLLLIQQKPDQWNMAMEFDVNNDAENCSR